MSFDENRLTCQCEKENKTAEGFQISHYCWLFSSDMAVKGLGCPFCRVLYSVNCRSVVPTPVCRDRKLLSLCIVRVYWAIQRSWFARVNALCNLSRKKSQEVAAHFRADFWVGVASRCV